jgi:hypothetical protein
VPRGEHRVPRRADGGPWPPVPRPPSSTSQRPRGRPLPRRPALTTQPGGAAGRGTVCAVRARIRAELGVAAEGQLESQRGALCIAPGRRARCTVGLAHGWRVFAAQLDAGRPRPRARARARAARRARRAASRFSRRRRVRAAGTSGGTGGGGGRRGGTQEGEKRLARRPAAGRLRVAGGTAPAEAARTPSASRCANGAGRRCAGGGSLLLWGRGVPSGRGQRRRCAAAPVRRQLRSPAHGVQRPLRRGMEMGLARARRAAVPWTA